MVALIERPRPGIALTDRSRWLPDVSKVIDRFGPDRSAARRRHERCGFGTLNAVDESALVLRDLGEPQRAPSALSGF